MGFCPRCRSEDALVAVEAAGATAPRVVSVAEASSPGLRRHPTGISEVDRVLGGGLVPGAAILLGGEPGVGKSTLLLQAAAGLAASGRRVLTVSDEESLDQIGLRASRLGVGGDGVLLAAESDVDAVVAAAGDLSLDALVVDSVQAVSVPEVGGAPGGVAQTRESAARLIRFAKGSGVTLVLVGHVTKDGGIAGPKLLEHAVDVVLYLEGDLDHGLRILRGLKNRFAPTHQVGLFEMREAGMVEVLDPAGLLDSGRLGEVPGSVVCPAVEGRRLLLVEVQALVAESSTPQLRRSVKGVEAARVHQIVAVLERHAGLSFAGKDVYVSVVGGWRLRDPGVDLPIAMALASSLLGRRLGPVAAWGEVGLTGDIRPVAHGERRTAEAERLGFSRVIGPSSGGSDRIHAALAAGGLYSQTQESRVKTHETSSKGLDS